MKLLTISSSLFQIPKGFNVNQEVELGVVIGKKGKFIKENEAFDYVGGYCLALDMTESGIMVIFLKHGTK